MHKFKVQKYQRISPTGTQPTTDVSLGTLLIHHEAKRLGIKSNMNLLTQIHTLKFQDQIKYYYNQKPSIVKIHAEYICKNKPVTKEFLRQNNISIPKGYILTNKDPQSYWSQVYNSLQKPIIIKPTNGSKAKNVFTDITNKKEYIAIITKFRKIEQTDLLVEEMFKAPEYRILATNKKILGIIKRIPANITGNGKSTIKQLIEKKNAQPIRNNPNSPYKKIKINQKVTNFLKDQNLNLQTILSPNQQVFLLPQTAVSIDNGGDTIDVTDLAHPSIKKIAIQAIKSIPGLSYTGIDLLTKDITKQQTSSSYSILELNTNPRISWQEFPSVGKRRYIAYEVLKLMFPQLPSKRPTDPINLNKIYKKAKNNINKIQSFIPKPLILADK